ncbi:MAG: TIGR03905 family TSCPD domain-containing protein [Ruminococcus sp.]|nr:TIGR03905 family TSCPD domain-containing protein [Ruminococcus sp.]
MGKISYIPKGVCSRQIDVEVEDGIVKYVKFTGGCNGNTQGVAKLATGMKAEDVIRLLKGTNCNGRGTSCPDQLSRAIELAMAED